MRVHATPARVLPENDNKTEDLESRKISFNDDVEIFGDKNGWKIKPADNADSASRLAFLKNLNNVIVKWQQGQGNEVAENPQSKANFPRYQQQNLLNQPHETMQQSTLSQSQGFKVQESDQKKNSESGSQINFPRYQQNFKMQQSPKLDRPHLFLDKQKQEQQKEKDIDDLFQTRQFSRGIQPNSEFLKAQEQLNQHFLKSQEEQNLPQKQIQRKQQQLQQREKYQPLQELPKNSETLQMPRNVHNSQSEPKFAINQIKPRFEQPSQTISLNPTVIKPKFENPNQSASQPKSQIRPKFETSNQSVSQNKTQIKTKFEPQIKTKFEPSNQIKTTFELKDESNDEFFKRSSKSEDGVIKISETKVEVSIDTEGFNKEELEVRVKDHIVTVEGKHEKVIDGRLWSRNFLRSFELPSQCKMEEISSNLNANGLLVITAPKSKPVQNGNIRTIPITRETEITPAPKLYIPTVPELKNVQQITQKNVQHNTRQKVQQNFQTSKESQNSYHEDRMGKLKALVEKFNQDDNEAIFQQDNFNTLQNLIMSPKLSTSSGNRFNSNLTFDLLKEQRPHL